jgi:hypothetical protein
MYKAADLLIIRCLSPCLPLVLVLRGSHATEFYGVFPY